MAGVKLKKKTSEGNCRLCEGKKDTGNYSNACSRSPHSENASYTCREIWVLQSNCTTTWLTNGDFSSTDARLLWKKKNVLFIIYWESIGIINKYNYCIILWYLNNIKIKLLIYLSNPLKIKHIFLTNYLHSLYN